MSQQIQSFDFGQPVATLVAAAAGGNSPDQLNVGHRGVKVYVNVTVLGGTTPALNVFVEEKDPVSGLYFPINGAVGLAITVTGLIVITVFPGLASSGGSVAGDVLPPTWRIRWTITGTTPTVTATIGASKLA